MIHLQNNSLQLKFGESLQMACFFSASLTYLFIHKVYIIYQIFFRDFFRSFQKQFFFFSCSEVLLSKLW